MVAKGSRGRELARGAVLGVGAGLVGVAAMTAGEKLEQAVTGRPSSYVPARALLTLLGRRPSDADRPAGWNHAMHWGTGAALGALRGVWAVTGLRGPVVNAWHTATRLAFDQTVENVTGAGAAPRTWPVQEQVVDVLHKAVYATVTGFVADRWIAPVLESTRGRVSH
jgi:hypothetical protein